VTSERARRSSSPSFDSLSPLMPISLTLSLSCCSHVQKYDVEKFADGKCDYDGERARTRGGGGSCEGRALALLAASASHRMLTLLGPATLLLFFSMQCALSTMTTPCTHARVRHLTRREEAARHDQGRVARTRKGAICSPAACACVSIVSCIVSGEDLVFSYGKKDGKVTEKHHKVTRRGAHTPTHARASMQLCQACSTMLMRMDSHLLTLPV
jgi:hypothetical protein